MNRTLQTLCRSLALLAVAMATVATAQDTGFDAVRVHPQAEREYGGHWEPVPQAIGITAGQRVRTSSNGRLALQLASGMGVITLGGDSLLRIHDTEPPAPPARMGLARVHLAAGVARIDAGRHDKRPSADLRVNLRALKLRVFGAEVWAETSIDSDEICLLRGAVEIVTPSGTERLDEPNNCLRWDGLTAQHLAAESTPIMAMRLARTAFPGEVAAESARMNTVTLPVPASSGVTITISGEAAPAPERYWSLVLASLPTLTAAEQEALRLTAQGMEVVVEPHALNGRSSYRLTFGTFETREAAQAALDELRKRPAFAKAWLLSPG